MSGVTSKIARAGAAARINRRTHRYATLERLDLHADRRGRLPEVGAGLERLPGRKHAAAPAADAVLRLQLLRFRLEVDPQQGGADVVHMKITPSAPYDVAQRVGDADVRRSAFRSSAAISLSAGDGVGGGAHRRRLGQPARYYSGGQANVHLRYAQTPQAASSPPTGMTAPSTAKRQPSPFIAETKRGPTS